jgi:hypothetical protein
VQLVIVGGGIIRYRGHPEYWQGWCLVYMRTICSLFCLLCPGRVILDELALDVPGLEIVPAPDEPALKVVPVFVVEPALWSTQP